MQIQVDTYQVEIPLPDLDTSKHREQFGLSTTNPLIRCPPRSFSPQQRRPPHSSLGVPSFLFHVVDGDVVAKTFVLKWVSGASRNVPSGLSVSCPQSLRPRVPLALLPSSIVPSPLISAPPPLSPHLMASPCWPIPPYVKYVPDPAHPTISHSPPTSKAMIWGRCQIASVNF